MFLVILNKKDRMKKELKVVSILIIILLATALRLCYLTKESVWIDETNSIDVAESGYRDLLNPPFYFLFLDYWMGVFGKSEFSIRFPSVLFGIFSVIFTYQIGKIFFNKKVGVVAAFILSINPFHVFYSQEARAYSLFTFLSLLSIYLFFKAINTNKNRYWYFFVLISILNLYTFYFALLVLVSEIIYLLIINYKLSNKKKKKAKINKIYKMVFSTAIILIAFTFLIKIKF